MIRFFMDVCVNARMVIQLIVFLSFHLKCFLLIFFLFCISVSKFPFKAVSIHFLSLFKQQWQTFAVSGFEQNSFLHEIIMINLLIKNPR